VEREQLSGAVEQVREGRRLRWQAQQPVELRYESQGFYGAGASRLNGTVEQSNFFFEAKW
jgi:hypothetical protein